MTSVEYIAGDEDGGLNWFGRSCSKRAARAEAAELEGRPALSYRVRPEHMIALVCPLHPAGVDGFDVGLGLVAALDAEHRRETELERDGCECYRVDEGWMTVCASETPGAVAVWRVEARHPPTWWFALSNRWHHLHPALPGYRPVLWGGRVARRSTRLDRLIVGRWWIWLPPDRWHRLGEGRDV